MPPGSANPVGAREGGVARPPSSFYLRPLRGTTKEFGPYGSAEAFGPGNG
jgi:hypothetical protein